MEIKFVLKITKTIPVSARKVRTSVTVWEFSESEKELAVQTAKALKRNEKVEVSLVETVVEKPLI